VATTAVNYPSLNFRLNAEQLAALREIAQKNGVSTGQLVRWAVDALIRQVDRNQGRLILPIDFSYEKKAI